MLTAHITSSLGAFEDLFRLGSAVYCVRVGELKLCVDKL